MSKHTKVAEPQPEKEKVEKTVKVSYHYKPDNLTLEQWQIALRKQAATKEHFDITEINTKEYPGYYKAKNPVHGTNTAWCTEVKTTPGTIARAWISR